MRRRVLNFLTLLSLLACVAVCVLWVRSYWRFDQVESYWPNGRQYLGFPGTRGIEVSSVRGVIFVGFFGSSLNMGNQSRLQCRSRPDPKSVENDFVRIFPRATALGFGVAHEPEVIRARIPQAWLLALASILPSLWLAPRLRNRRRARIGLCPSCGYDLRATPGRCPECGREAAGVG